MKLTMFVKDVSANLLGSAIVGKLSSMSIEAPTAWARDHVEDGTVWLFFEDSDLKALADGIYERLRIKAEGMEAEAAERKRQLEARNPCLKEAATP